MTLQAQVANLAPAQDTQELREDALKKTYLECLGNLSAPSHGYQIKVINTCPHGTKHLSGPNCFGAYPG